MVAIIFSPTVGFCDCWLLIGFSTPSSASSCDWLSVPLVCLSRPVICSPYLHKSPCVRELRASRCKFSWCDLMTSFQGGWNPYYFHPIVLIVYSGSKLSFCINTSKINFLNPYSRFVWIILKLELFMTFLMACCFLFLSGAKSWLGSQDLLIFSSFHPC